jgi:hypothetical protein
MVGESCFGPSVLAACSGVATKVTPADLNGAWASADANGTTFEATISDNLIEINLVSSADSYPSGASPSLRPPSSCFPDACAVRRNDGLGPAIRPALRLTTCGSG